MKKRIAIIIPYFGKWPDWFNLYHYSCSKNAGIDWIFYTDCLIPLQNYNNTFFHSISFKDYCKNVSNKLGIDFYPDSPYKLCGLKPFYGFIHSDILVDYEFWGFGDIDVIW